MKAQGRTDYKDLNDLIPLPEKKRVRGSLKRWVQSMRQNNNGNNEVKDLKKANQSYQKQIQVGEFKSALMRRLEERKTEREELIMEHPMMELIFLKPGSKKAKGIIDKYMEVKNDNEKSTDVLE